jgi:hypothetical protein
MNTLAAAIHYARLGFAIFPVAGDCRTPLVKRGLYGAATTEAEVRRLWSSRPDGNVSCACGPTGVLVLDVDNKGADGLATLAELVRRWGKLPPTWRTRTPSGGLHIWFKAPAGRVRNRVGFLPGLDVRGAGASVCLPPSRKPAGAYAWEVKPYAAPLAALPEWLLTLMDPPPPPRPQKPPLRLLAAPLGTKARYVAAAVERECAAVASTPADSGRNQRLFVAAARLGELVGADLLPADLAERALGAAANDCGLVHDDGLRAVAATIASGLARGVQNPREVRS